MIFQDPISSLNPRRRVGDIVAEPLRSGTTARPRSARSASIEVLESVGLDPEVSRPASGPTSSPAASASASASPGPWCWTRS